MSHDWIDESLMAVRQLAALNRVSTDQPVQLVNSADLIRVSAICCADPCSRAERLFCLFPLLSVQEYMIQYPTLTNEYEKSSSVRQDAVSYTHLTLPTTPYV